MAVSTRIEAFLKAAEARAKGIAVSRRGESWAEGMELFRAETTCRAGAKTFAYALAREPRFIFDGEGVTGMFYFGDSFGTPEYGLAARNFHARLRRELPEYLKLFGMVAEDAEIDLTDATVVSGTTMGPGHIGWHWDWIVRDGVEGVKQRIARARAKDRPEAADLLDGAEIALDAMLEWAESHLEEMRLRPASPWRDERIACLERVPRYGARNFREAVQAFHFAYLAGIFECPAGGNSPGRLDYYLAPYLERDLAAGAISESEARDLVDELFIRFHERLRWNFDGMVETIVLAGSHPDGTPAGGALTRIMVESFTELKGLTHPSVYLRLAEHAPDWQWRLGIDYLKKGGNRAQLINDSAVVRAMTAAGMNLEDARDYMCGGCMELSSFAKNGDLLFTGFFNVAKVLEYVLTGGVCLISGRKVFDHLGDGLGDYASFEELLAAFEAEYARALRLTFRAMEIWCEVYQPARPMTYISTLVDDCLERGKPINAGGARYEDFGSTPLGIPNAADSLAAIRQVVYREKSLDPAEFQRLLCSDFAGAEALRQRLRSLPKYGQGENAAGELMRRLSDFTCDIYAERRNCLGGIFKPMIMTFMMAPWMGRHLGASADGRHARDTIAHGITPSLAALKSGIGGAMLAATQVGVERYSGGASHIWDLDAELAEPAYLRRLLEVFFERGGQMFQGNVIDAEVLIAAEKDPENYPGLTVRVGGYSALFATLDPDNRKEIIARLQESKR